MNIRPMLGLSLCLVLCNVNALASGAAAPDNLAQARTHFLEAEHALHDKNMTVYRGLKAKLHDYPLYPYLVYQEMQRNIPQLSLTEVKQFQSAHTDSPLSEQLRDQWLSYHFDHKHWMIIRDAYQPNDSLAHQCQYSWANYTLHPDATQLDAIGTLLWGHDQALPPTCTRLLQLWQKHTKPTPTQIWARFQRLLSKESYTQAGQLVTLLPKAQQPLARYWLESHHSKAIVLPFRHENEVPDMSVAMKTDLWCHWANHFPSKTAAMWQQYPKDTLPVENQETIAHALGLYLAIQGNPEAERWIKEVPDAYRSDTLREWHVRLAIAHANWPQVLSLINDLTPEQRKDTAWRYWAARAHEGMGQITAAKHGYQQIVDQYDYYGLLARVRLKIPTKFPSIATDAHLKQTDIDALQKIPAIQRVSELFLINRPLDARREWFKLMGQLTADQQLDAAALATEKAWYNLALHSLRPLREDLAPELRYPKPHFALINHVAERNQIEAAWIYAIILKESQFAADIKSPVGALGLMQLMPTTAQEVAKQMNIRLDRPLALMNEELNVTLGTRYFKELLALHHDNPVYAVAAYNAGSKPVTEWEAHHARAMDQWVETIPFQETRNYVKKVVNHYAMYQSMMGNERAGAQWFQ
ncbi:MAG: transglycosylase SLT domain-containing protein [Pseudomonadota bacterium]